MTTKQYNDCVRLFSNRVYRFILKSMKDADSAQDVVQNAFEILWNKHQDVNFEKARSYLFTVAYHNMIDQFRKNGRETMLVEEHSELGFTESSYTGLMELIETGAQKLPEAQRSVIMLRDYEGYSYEEISNITGLNLSQVKVYLFRARKFLRSYIQKMEAIDESR